MIFFFFYIVELIIMLLVNFILGKKFRVLYKCTFISLHIHLNVLRKFMILCWATFRQPCFNRMELKKDMRNDNLFFKRVTDIIPDYPFSIDMEERAKI